MCLILCLRLYRKSDEVNEDRSRHKIAELSLKPHFSLPSVA